MTALDDRLLAGFTVLDVHDPDEMGVDSRVSRRLPTGHNAHTYTLRNRLPWREKPAGRLTRLAIHAAGDFVHSYVADSFGTEVGLIGEGLPRYCLGMMLAGGAEMLTGTGQSAAMHGRLGLVYRGEPGLRFLTTDGNARMNLWVDARRIESALEALLDDTLREALVFHPSLDWGTGRGASIHRLVWHLAEEFVQPDGMASNALALRSFTDLLVHAMLNGLPHNYTERLAQQKSGPAPRHLRRAEEYLRGHAGRPLGVQEVAAAAGCSVRALQLAFRQFRDTTPLAALQRIRLEQAHAELVHPQSGASSTLMIARKYGFTNAGRFATAYARRFGELPSETLRMRR